MNDDEWRELFNWVERKTRKTRKALTTEAESQGDLSTADEWHAWLARLDRLSFWFVRIDNIWRIGLRNYTGASA